MVKAASVTCVCINDWVDYFVLHACNAALPQPEVNITSIGSSVGGEHYTLACTVTTISGLVSNTSIESTWLDQDGKTLRTQSTQSTSSSLSLEFQQLRTSHGGQYTCVGTVIIPQLSERRNNSASSNIVVESEFIKRIHGYSTLLFISYFAVPKPVVSIVVASMDALLSGNPLQLTCVIELSAFVDTEVVVTVQWKHGEQLLANDGRITITEPIQAGSLTYNASLHFQVLSSVLDSNNYMCVATAESTGGGSVVGATASAQYTLSVTGRDGLQ